MLRLRGILLNEREAAMSAIQKLWHHISGLPFFSFFNGRNPAAEPLKVSDQTPVIFKECEDDCGQSAEEIQAEESERAEQFKRDQVLPIMGMTGRPI